MESTTRLAIVGYSIKAPGCSSNLDFKENNFIFKDNITQIPLERTDLTAFATKFPDLRGGFVKDIDKFDNNFFGVKEEEAEGMDPQQRLALQTTLHAIEDSGIPLSQISTLKPVVYCSCWSTDYRDLIPNNNQHLVPGNMGSMIAGRISHFLNSHGSSLCIESACSSGLAAVHQAKLALQRGDTEMAIVVATHLLGERTFSALNAGGLLASDGVLKAFDVSADGYSRAEGFSALLITTEEIAMKMDLRSHMFISKTSTNNDGYTRKLLAPNRMAQFYNHEAILQSVSSDDIDVIVAHGTGTKAGDRTEINALRDLLPGKAVLAPKTSFGHNETVSSHTALLSALSCAKAGYLPAQLHLKLPIEQARDSMQLLFVGEERIINKALISSYGISGTNVNAIIERGTSNIQKKNSNIGVLLFSAKSRWSLRRSLDTWIEYLETTNDSMDDILYTNHCRRGHYTHRFAVTGGTRRAIIEKLKRETSYQMESTDNVIHFGSIMGLNDFEFLLDLGIPVATMFDNILKELNDHVVGSVPKSFLCGLLWIRICQTLEIPLLAVSGEGVGFIIALYTAGLLTLEESVKFATEFSSNKGSLLPPTNANESGIKVYHNSGEIYAGSELFLYVGEVPSSGVSLLSESKEKSLLTTEGIEELIRIAYNAGADLVLPSSGTLVDTPQYQFEEKRFWPVPVNKATDQINDHTTGEQVYEHIVNTLKSCGYPAHQITDGTPIDWDYFDSLTSVELTEKIRQFCPQKLQFSDFQKHATLTQLVTAVYANYANKMEPTCRKDILSNNVNESENFYIQDLEFISPFGTDMPTFSDNLRTSVTRKGGLPRATLLNSIDITTHELEHIDPHYINLLNCAYKLKERMKKEDLRSSPIVYAVNSWSVHRKQQTNQESKTGTDLLCGTHHAIAASRIALVLGSNGSVSTVDSTCSSVHTALQNCMAEMQRANAKFGFVATSNRPDPEMKIDGINTAEETKSFDVDHCGYRAIEFCGILMINRTSTQVDGLLKINCIESSFTGSILKPQLLSNSMNNQVGNVDFIELHGTGTVVGDEYEGYLIESIPSSSVLFGSQKSNIGHAEASCGMLQLMKMITLGQQMNVPSQLHLSLPVSSIRNNKRARLPFIGEELGNKEQTKFAIFANGVDGQQAVVQTSLRQEFAKKGVEPQGYLLFPISAESEPKLKQRMKAVAFFAETTNVSLQDISNYLLRQDHHQVRVCYTAKTREQLIRKFENITGTQSTKLVIDVTDPDVVLPLLKFKDFENDYNKMMKQDFGSIKYVVKHKFCVAVAFCSLIDKINCKFSIEASGIEKLAHEFYTNHISFYSCLSKLRTSESNGCLIVNNSESESNSTPIKANYKRLLEYFSYEYQHGAQLNFEALHFETDRTSPLLYFLELEDFLATSSKVSMNEADILKDHIIDASTIVPAAFWISSLVSSTSNINIRNFVLSRMWLVKDGVDAKCNVDGILIGSNSICSFLKADQPIPVPKPRFRTMRDAQTTLKKRKIYERFKRNNHSYGPTFQVLESVNIGRHGGKFLLNASCKSPTQLFESALQAPIVHYLEVSKRSSVAIVPFIMDGIWASDGLLDASQGYYNIECKDGSVTADIVLQNSKQETVTLLTGVYYKAKHSGEQSPTKPTRPRPAKIIKSVNVVSGKVGEIIVEWLKNNMKLPDVDSKLGFFSMGMNSIQIVYLAEHLKKLKFNVNVTDLFNHPSIEQICGYIESTNSAKQGIPKKNQRERIVPCSSSTYSSTSSVELSDLSDADKSFAESKNTTLSKIAGGEANSDFISVISSACRLPGTVKDRTELWDLLKSGRNVNKLIPSDRISTRNTLLEGKKYGRPLDGGYFLDGAYCFDHKLFHISKSEAEVMDPQQRLLLECAHECLHQVGIHKPKSIGVFIGLMGTEYPDAIGARTDALSMLSSAASIISGRVSYTFGLRGPCSTIDTACSSSLVALEQAVKALENGDCEYALVGGVNLILNESGLGQRSNGGMLHPRGICHSFDSNAGGYGRADGCVMVLITKGSPEGTLIRKIKSNHCGHGSSLTAPNGKAQEELMLQILQGKQVSLWDAHGTGTILGDPIEFNTLSAVLDSAIVTTAKTSLGHGEASAGVTSVLKSELQMENQYVPPHLHFSSINQHIDPKGITLPIVGQEHDMSTAGVSSFGIAGTNAECILDYRKPIKKCYHWHATSTIFPITALTEGSLTRYKKIITEFLESTNECIMCVAARMFKAPVLRFSSIVKYQKGRISFMDHNNDQEGCNIILMTKPITELTGNPYVTAIIQELTNNNFSPWLALAVVTVKFLNALYNSQIELRTSCSYIAAAVLYLDGLITKAELLDFQVRLISSQSDDTMNELKKILQKRSNESALHRLTLVTNVDDSRVEVSTMADVYSICSKSWLNSKTLDLDVLFQKVDTTFLVPNYPFENTILRLDNPPVSDPILGVCEYSKDDKLIFRNQLSRLRNFPVFCNYNSKALCCRIVATAAVKCKLTPCTISFTSLCEADLNDMDWVTTVVDLPGSTIQILIDDSVVAKISVSKCQYVAFASSNTRIKALNHSYFSTCRRENETLVSTSVPEYLIYIIVQSLQDIRIESLAIYGNCQLTEFQMLDASGNFEVVDKEGNLLAIFNTKQDRCDKQETYTVPSISQYGSQEHIARKPIKSNTHIIGVLREILSDIVVEESHPFADDAPFSLFGLDSLGSVDFANRSNNAFPGLHLDTTDIFNCPNLLSLAELISTRHPITREKEKQYIGELSFQSHTVADSPTEVLQMEKQQTPITLSPGSSSHASSYRNELSNCGTSTSITPSSSDSQLNSLEFTSTKGNQTTHKMSNTLCIRKKHVRQPADLTAIRYEREIGEFIIVQNNRRHLASDFLSARESCHGQPYEMLIKDTEINFEELESLFKAFTQFCGALVEKERFIFYLENKDSLFVTVMKAALKTASSELHPSIRYVWTEELHPVMLPHKQTPDISIPRNWLISGGTAGIGLAIASHLAQNGNAVNIVLLSRRSVAAAAKALQSLQNSSCKITVLSVDVANKAHLIEQLSSLPFKIDAIVHSAGTTRDALMKNQSRDNFRYVYSPKVEGVHNLEFAEKTLGWKLKNFIVMSSIAAITGNRGQLNYSITNAALDHMMDCRKQKGLPGQTINWGNWLETGMAVRVNEHLAQIGFLGLTTREGLEAFDLVLHHNIPQLVVANIDWNAVFKHREDLCENQIFIDDDVSSSEVIDSPALLNASPEAQGFWSETQFISARRSYSDFSEVFVSGKIVFMFPGQGSHYSNAGLMLAKTFKVFSNTMCHIQGRIDLIVPNSTTSLTLKEQLEVFKFGMASFSLWMSVGLKPDFVIGHSVGEITALTAAGILSVETAIKLIAARAKLMERMSGSGLMIAIDRRAMDIISKEDNVYVSADNSSRQIVIGGLHSNVIRFITKAVENGYTSRLVSDKYAFHCPLFSPEDLSEFRNDIKGIQFKEAQFQVISSNSGELLTIPTTEHLIQQTISTVNFVKGIHTLQSLGVNRWIDMGPGEILSTFVKRTVHGPYCIGGTSASKERELRYFLRSAGFLINDALGFVLPEYVIDIQPFARYTNNHFINGEPAVPGVFTIFNVLKYLQTFDNSERIALSDIQFLSVWKPNDRFGHILIEPQGTLRVTVAGTVIFMCKYMTETEFKSALHFSDISSWTSVPHELLYSRDKRFSPGYGDSLHLVDNIRIKDNRIRSELRDVDDAANSFTLLLEAALQTVLAWIRKRMKNKTCVPISIGKLTVRPMFDIRRIQERPVVEGEITTSSTSYVGANVSAWIGKEKLFDFEKVVALLPKESEKELVPLLHSFDDTHQEPSNVFEKTQLATDDILKTETRSSSHHVSVYDYDIIACGRAHDKNNFWEVAKTSELIDNKRQAEANGCLLMNADKSLFDANYFNITPVEAKFLDPQQRLLLECVRRAIHRCPSRMPKNTGVFVGCGPSEFAQLLLKKLPVLPPYVSTGTHPSALAGRLAHYFNFDGPAISIDTACSSSLVALCNAADAIINNQCEMAIVCGVNIIVADHNTDVLREAKMLSPIDICRTFDASADGYVRGEAVSCIIIGKHNRYLPSIDKWAVMHTGFSSAMTVPRSSSQIELLRKVAGPIDLVECHITGTRLGDPIEVESIQSVFDSSKITVTGSKAQFGHCEPTSGLLSFISVLHMMKHQYCTAIPHLEVLNQKFAVPPKVCFIGQEQQIKSAIVNSFGFTGTNAAISISRAFEVEKEAYALKKLYIIRISTKLTTMMDTYEAHVMEFVLSSAEQLYILEIAFAAMPVQSNVRYLVIDFKRRLVTKVDEEGRMAPRSQNITLGDFSSYPGPEMLANNQVVTKEDLSAVICNGPYCDVSKLTRFIDLPIEPLKRDRHWPFDNVDSEVKMIVGPNADADTSFGDATRDTTKTAVTNLLRVPSLMRYLAPAPQSCSTLPTHFHQIDLTSPIDNFESKFVSVDFTGMVDKAGSPSVLFERIHNLVIIFGILNKREGLIIASKQADSTSNLEVISIMRTLASEYSRVRYKVVIYENIQQLLSEYNENSLFDIVVWKNTQRFVERLELVQKEVPAPIKTKISSMIITGSGGISTELVKYYKPRNAWILSRSRPENLPSNVMWLKTDVTNAQEVASAFSHIPNVDVVAHCAGLVKNKLAKDLNQEDLENVVNVKVKGLLNLLAATKHMEIGNFIVVSSVASVLGSFGQINYVAANSLMSSLAEKSERPISIIHLGPIEDVGMLSGTRLEPIRKQISSTGWKMLSSKNVVPAMLTATTGTILFDVDVDLLLRNQPHLSASMCRPTTSQYTKKMQKKANESDVLSCTPSKGEIWEALFSVTGKFDNLGKDNTGFMSLGMDSLMIEQLRTEIEKRFNVQIRSSDFYDNPTVTSIRALIAQQLETKYSNSEAVSDGLTSLPSTEINNNIVITGYSGSCSGCADIDDLWEHLLRGDDLITRHDTHDEDTLDAAGFVPNIDLFDNTFWNVAKEEADALDPQMRMFLQHSYKAVENSGIITDLQKHRVGVYASAEPSEYGDWMSEPTGSLTRLFKMNMKDFLATWTAHKMNLQGPAIGVYSACSSFLVGIRQAENELRTGAINVALVGAASLVLPENSKYETTTAMVMSSDGYCRPFDQSSSGTVRGSALGVVILQRKQDVKPNQKIYAEISSIGVSNDGAEKASFMAPNSKGQMACMINAHSSLPNIEIQKIKFVECHGTGTTVGDEIELKALEAAYKHNITIGSVKANIGHGFAAAGFVSLFKTMKILETGLIPPQIRLKQPSPYLKGNMQINTATRKIPDKKFNVAISSFGIGGTNAHIVLSQGTTEEIVEGQSKIEAQCHVLPISGNTVDAVIRNCRALAEYIENNMNRVNLSQLAATLQFKREHMQFRTAVAVSTVVEASEKLRQILEDSLIRSEPLTSKDIAVMFGPQGVQYRDLFKDSISNECSIFSSTLRQMLKKSNEITGHYFKAFITDEYSEKTAELERRTETSQVLLFSLMYSICVQLNDWGIEADTTAGHSLGEYCALAYAHCLSLDEMLRLIKERGALCASTPSCSMIAVQGNLDQTMIPEDVYISAYLWENFHCLVGNAEAMRTVKKQLTDQQIEFKEIKTQHGFHSPFLDSIVSSYEETARKFMFKTLTKRVISNVDGSILEEVTPTYLRKHLRQPVRMDKTLDTLSSLNKKLVIQIGASGILEYLLKDRNFRVVQAIPNPKKVPCYKNYLLQVFGELWSNGYPVNFGKVNNCSQWDWGVPTYQFAPIRCWREKKKSIDNENNIKNLVFVPTSRNVIREKLPTSVLQISNYAKDNCELISCSTAFECEKEAARISEHASRILPDIVVYHLHCEEDSILDHVILYTYYFIQKLLFGNCLKGKFIVAASGCTELTWLAIGPLRERILLTRQEQSYFVELSGTLPLEEILTVMDYRSTSSIFRIIGRTVETLTYAHITPDEPPKLGNCILVIGGASGVAQELLPTLLHQNPQAVIYVSSRRHSEESSIYKSIYLDLLNMAQLRKSIKHIVDKEGKINTVIFMAGLPPSEDRDKRFDSVAPVLTIKVKGLQSLRIVLKEMDQNLENLIISSSLSSVLGIQGTSDYASANLYCDALAMKDVPTFGRILSIQWPPWKNVGMMSSADKQLTSIFKKGMITAKEGRKLFTKALEYRGCVSVGKEDPFKLRHNIAERILGVDQDNNAEIHTESNPWIELRKIWNSVLCTTTKDETNFFEHGGNSISALKISWAILEKLDIDVKTNVLFENPVFSEFAKKVLAKGKEVSGILKITRTDGMPLSYAQENMFLLNELEKNNKYQIVFTLRFKAQDVSLFHLTTAVHYLIAHQSGLRTTFGCNRTQMYQTWMSLTESYYNINWKDMNECIYRDEAKKASNSVLPIDKFCMNIFSAVVGIEARILFVQHHIITDGWSMSVLAKELGKTYANLVKNQKPLPGNDFTIADFAAYQRSGSINLHLSELVTRLKPHTEDNYTEIHSYSTKHNVDKFRRDSFIIPSVILKQTQSLAQEHNTTEFLVMLAAFVMVLRAHQAVNSDDIIIGSPVAGRTVKEVEELIGYFLNNIVIHVNVKLTDSLSSIIEKCKIAVLESRTYESVPFHLLVKELGARKGAKHPIFNIYFNFRHQLDFPRVKLGDTQCEVEHNSMNTVFDFSMTIDDTPAGYQVLLEYKSNLYPKEQVRGIYHHFLRVLRSSRNAAPTDKHNSKDFPLLSLSRIFQSQALLTPSSTCVHSDFADSYEGFIQSREAMACYMGKEIWIVTGQSPRSDSIIPVKDHMNDTMMQSLSIAMCGLAYAPFSETTTNERFSLLSSRLQSAVINIDLKTINNSKLFSKITYSTVHPHDLLYVIHTSGTTGDPKAVPISHANLTCFLTSATRETLLRPGLRLSHSVNACFDVSKFNYWGSICNGATLLLHEELVTLPLEVEARCVNSLFLPSAVFNSLPSRVIEGLAKQLERLILGGESVQTQKLESALQLNLDVLQIYGPSECTVWSLTNRCKCFEDSGALIGRCVGNETCQLSACKEPVSNTFQKGEVVLSGDKLSRGYINSDDPSFGPDNARAYRTGDVGVLLPNNKIRYLERIDHQVKINGMRVDVREIENIILRSSSHVLDVRAFKADGVLVAFVAAHNLDIDSLQLHLKKSLNSEAVPKRIVRVDSIPKTASGKVDARGLLGLLKTQVPMCISPQSTPNSLERKILEIASSVLGKEVDLTDNFFQSGGHSLLVLEFVEQLSEVLNIIIQYEEVFKNTTFSDLAKTLQPKYFEMKKATTSDQIIVIRSLRAVKYPKYNVYAIHAIAGTIYPYIVLLSIFPEDVAIYAVEYKTDYQVETLTELSTFYAEHIAVHTGKVQPVLIGHSLGGTIAREIAPELEMFGYKVPCIIVLDTWRVKNGTLQEEHVKRFIKEVFQGMGNVEKHVEKSVKLMNMLQTHKYLMTERKIYLFKAKELGRSALQSAIRPDLTEEMVRACRCNGLQTLSTQQLEITIVNGDHESMMKEENLSAHKDTILRIIDFYF